MRKTVPVFVACMMLVAVASTAQATVFTLYASDAGTFSSNGVHLSANDNYFAGFDLSGENDVFRDFFTFDIPALDGPVIGATLRAPNPLAVSPDPAEQYEVFSYTAGLDLHTDYFGGASGVTIFNNLGSGVQYGSALVTIQPPDDPVVVALNSSSWAVIDGAQGGEFPLGGAITSLNVGGAFDEGIFAATQGWQLSPGTDDNPVLIITTRTGPQEPIIPEPATLALLGAGLLAATRRRRRK
jgi:hypothetical protein